MFDSIVNNSVSMFDSVCESVNEAYDVVSASVVESYNHVSEVVSEAVSVSSAVVADAWAVVCAYLSKTKAFIRSDSDLMFLAGVDLVVFVLACLLFVPVSLAILLAKYIVISMIANDCL